MKVIKSILVAVVIILLLCGIASCNGSLDRKKIENHVEDLGGQVISIDHKFFFQNTPYWFVNAKSDRVYKFIYKNKLGEEFAGWVKFGGIVPSWILENE